MNSKMMVGMVLGVFALAVASPAFASEWQSRYTVPGNPPVNACVVLQGDSGCYTLDDGTMGTLSSITYARVGKSGMTIIRGRWSLQCESGNFEWRVVQDGSQFLGRWSSPVGGSGTWNGSRAGNSGAAPVKPKRRPRQ